MTSPDFLIAGAGIFGVCTAIELKKKGFDVTIINPDEIPHPLAASTDISKIIRMEYGTDGEYMDMAYHSMLKWREWNHVLNDKVFEESGYIMLSSSDRKHEPSYELASVNKLIVKGFKPDILDGKDITERFPCFNTGVYKWGSFQENGGYGFSGKAVGLLLQHAIGLGVNLHLSGLQSINTDKGSLTDIVAEDGTRFYPGHLIVCAGNHTPYLIPELKPFMKVTGHPVFHLKPADPELFKPPFLTAFAADIANTGWYGFPYHPEKGVVKIANHGVGLELDPNTDPRVVTHEDALALRSFLKSSIPSLAYAPIVYTRRCCYTDTLDGHFWIDNHPEIKGITIGSGGSGHGFKMGPEVGYMISEIALGSKHKYSDRYKWRELNEFTIQEEEARNN